MKTKFKTYQKVKSISNKLPFKINEVLTIIMIDPSLSETLRYFIENSEGVGCWCSDVEIKINK